ncbi:MAG: hypothetical protein AB4062_20070 [Crocosphaera sp.]
MNHVWVIMLNDIPVEVYRDRNMAQRKLSQNIRESKLSYVCLRVPFIRDAYETE